MHVEHDPNARRFTVALPGGAAVLAYAPRGDAVLEFFSTYVPPAHRGRGVAARLVEAGLDYARAQGCRVVPTCWYVRQWMRAHPEYEDLLAA
jgi:uncharacterized protein